MATLSTRRGYWVLNWSDSTGRHRKSLGRLDVLPERDAKTILKAKRLELSTGTAMLARPGACPQFGHYVGEYLMWHARQFPHSHYRVKQIVEDHLLPRFEFQPLDMMDKREVEQFVQERMGVAESGTVIKELRTLRAVVNRAVAEGLLLKSPLDAVTAPRNLNSKPHRFYEADELGALYAACQVEVNAGNGPQPDPVHAAVWKLYANTGMRRMEGLHLRRRDVGRDGLRVLSTGEERTKSGQWREIPLTDGARMALETLPKSERVLPQVTPPSLSRAFVRDAARAGLDGSLHTLRHTYISHLVRAGVPLRTVQLYAGHAHYSTTEQYAYLAPGRTPIAVSSLSL